MDLNTSGATDTIRSLYIAGVPQAAGEWGSAAYTDTLGDVDANGVQTVTVTVTNEPVNGKLFVRVRAE